MDSSVTYVDLAVMAGRYSLHSRGESEEVKQEKEKKKEEQAEKEEVVGKGDKVQSIHFSPLTPQ